MAEQNPKKQLQERFDSYVAAYGEEETKETVSALAEGRELVENYVGNYQVPTEILDRAIIEVAAELFYRKSSRNGVSEFAGADLVPFRITRDAMKAAYPLLNQFIPAGIA